MPDHRTSRRRKASSTRHSRRAERQIMQTLSDFCAALPSARPATRRSPSARTARSRRDRIGRQAAPTKAGRVGRKRIGLELTRSLRRPMRRTSRQASRPIPKRLSVLNVSLLRLQQLRSKRDCVIRNAQGDMTILVVEASDQAFGHQRPDLLPREIDHADNQSSGQVLE